MPSTLPGPMTLTDDLARWLEDKIGEEPVMLVTDRWYDRPPQEVGALLQEHLSAAEMTLGVQEAGAWGRPVWLVVTDQRVALLATDAGAGPRWDDLGPQAEVEIEAKVLGRDTIVVGGHALEGEHLGRSLRELARFAGQRPLRRFIEAAQARADDGEPEEALVLANVARTMLEGEAATDDADLIRALTRVRARAAVKAGDLETLDETLTFGYQVTSQAELETLGEELGVARGAWVEALGHALFASGDVAAARLLYERITRHRPKQEAWQSWCVARCADAQQEPAEERARRYAQIARAWRADPEEAAPDGRSWMFEAGRALPDVLLKLSRAREDAGQPALAREAIGEALERAPLSATIVARWLELHDDGAPRADRVRVVHGLLAASGGQEGQAASGQVAPALRWGPWVEGAGELLHPKLRGIKGKVGTFLNRQFADPPSTANLQFLFKLEDAEATAALEASQPLVDDEVWIDPRLCLDWRGVESRERDDGRTFLLIGTRHLDAEDDCHLDPAAWRFVITGQVALIRHNLALVGSEQYKKALVGTLVDLGPTAFGYVPVVGKPVEHGIQIARKWWGKGDRALRFVSKHADNAVTRLFKASRGGDEAGALGKAKVAGQALWGLCSADRYALAAVGDIAVATRAMLSSSQHHVARASMVGVRDLEDVLGVASLEGDGEAAAELIQIQIRVEEMLKFVVSEEFDAVLAAAGASAVGGA